MGKSKKIKFICFPAVLILLSVSFLILTSCMSKEEKEWNQINETGSIESLLDFSVKYKDGKFIDELNKKINEKIKSEENSDKLKSFLTQYPERTDDFKDRIAELALNSALDENNPEALEKYISDFANYGKNIKYIDDAKTALKNMYFNIAKEQKSIRLLQEIFHKYREEDPVMSQQAASAVDDIYWEIFTRDGTLAGYLDYIDAYCEGNHAEEAYKKIEELNWQTALEITESDNTLLALQNFIEYYPESIYLSEAEQLIKKIQNDSKYSEKYFKEPTLDLLDEFILNFPGHKDINKAVEMRKDFIGDIHTFMKKGYLEAAGLGDSITRTRIIVENRTNSKLIVTIPFGMYFAAKKGYTQNMLAREELTFTVEAGKKRSLYVKTACMNIYRDIPDNSSVFTIDKLEEYSPLIPLLNILAENKSGYAVTQSAVWQIMDDPGKGIILDTLEYEDGSYAISENDYNEALRLIDIAMK